MLILSALWVLTNTAPGPHLAPMPREARGWVTQHTFKHKSPVRTVAAIADVFVTGDRDGVLLLWDARTGKLRETLLDGTSDINPISAVRPAPNGKRLNVLANGSFGQIEMTGSERTYLGPDGFRTGFALSDDGYGFAPSNQELFGDSGTLCVLQHSFTGNSILTGIPYRVQHPAEVRLAASARGFLASVDAEHTVRGWKPKYNEITERAVWSVDLKQLKPETLAVSPDGALVAVAGAKGAGAVLDAKTGKVVATLTGHKGAVRAVAFTADSGLIATGGDDGTVRLWNPWTGEQEYQLKGHTAPVVAVWFAPDDTLLSASDDNTARAWVYKP